jgi:hypothetical protein
MSKKDLYRWIPTDYTKVSYKDPVDAVVYVGINARGKFSAIGYSGKRGKHDFYYQFPTAEKRAEYILKFFENHVAHNKRKEEDKKNRNGRLTEAAQVAAIIKKELKTRFPQYKFSATSENFSGGDSVTVSSVDVPPAIKDQVESLIDSYKSGYFDGMQDLYVYVKRDDNLPTVKYTHFRNEMSDKTRDAIEEWGKANFGDWDYEKQANSAMWRVFCGSHQCAKEFWRHYLPLEENIAALSAEVVNTYNKMADNLEHDVNKESIIKYLNKCTEL